MERDEFINKLQEYTQHRSKLLLDYEISDKADKLTLVFNVTMETDIDRNFDGFLSFIIGEVPCLCGDIGIRTLCLQGEMLQGNMITRLITECIVHGMQRFEFVRNFEYNFTQVELVEINNAVSYSKTEVCFCAKSYNPKWVRSLCVKLAGNENARLCLSDGHVFDHLKQVNGKEPKSKAKFELIICDYHYSYELREQDGYVFLLDFLRDNNVVSLKIQFNGLMTEDRSDDLLRLLSSGEVARMETVSLLELYVHMGPNVNVFLKGPNRPSLDFEYSYCNKNLDANLKTFNVAASIPFRTLTTVYSEQIGKRLEDLNKNASIMKFAFEPGTLVLSEAPSNVNVAEINENIAKRRWILRLKDECRMEINRPLKAESEYRRLYPRLHERVFDFL